MLEEISAHELKRLLESDGDKPLLIDVREPVEYQYCRIEESRHIPMNLVPTHLDRLDRGRNIVVICHHGLRSRQVGHFLISHGFDRVINLMGGIDAWSVEVDPGVPRY